MDASTKSNAESTIESLKASLQSGNILDVKKKAEDLEKIAHELAQKLYAQQAPQGAPGAGFQGTPGDGGAPTGQDDSEVVDVDYEIVDEE